MSGKANNSKVKALQHQKDSIMKETQPFVDILIQVDTYVGVRTLNDIILFNKVFFQYVDVRVSVFLYCYNSTLLL